MPKSINLNAYDYNESELNSSLSKLNTTITSKAIQDTIVNKLKSSEGQNIKKNEHANENNSNLEERVSQNTESLKQISNQLNNIIELLHSKESIQTNELEIIENSEYNNHVGRNAEYFLNDALKKYLDKKLKISWVNEKEEQHHPYDFTADNGQTIYYYECKGTTSDLLEFQVTRKEWEFYLRQKGKYILYFVKNVDGKPSFVKFTDLIKNMEEGLIVPCSFQNKAYKANRIVFSINESKLSWIF